jgi:hypothetical protein
MKEDLKELVFGEKFSDEEKESENENEMLKMGLVLGVIAVGVAGALSFWA